MEAEDQEGIETKMETGRGNMKREEEKDKMKET